MIHFALFFFLLMYTTYSVCRGGWLTGHAVVPTLSEVGVNDSAQLNSKNWFRSYQWDDIVIYAAKEYELAM